LVQAKGGEVVMNKECGCQTRSDEFTAAQLTAVDAVISKFKARPGALIPVLEEVQGITGYLPEEIQRRVAKGLSIPLAQVYGVVTFYSFFTMTPRGKHQVRVCLGTACHVRGGQQVVEKLEEELKIMPGECTEDRQFSLDIVRCLGCCALAPVMVVDENIHKQLKAPQLPQIMKKYR
jgi:NADH:ubiquinone oxidoreductase subunit E